MHYNFVHNPASSKLDATTAALPAPTNLMASSPTATSITVTWERPEGADAVDSYEINYQYIIEECYNYDTFPTVTVSVANSSLRRYTLSNSSSIPVEEDSLFRILLTAVNNVTRSVPSQYIMTTTAEAGMNCFKLLAMIAIFMSLS